MLPSVVSKWIQLEKAWQYGKETVKVLQSGSKLTRSQCWEWRCQEYSNLEMEKQTEESMNLGNYKEYIDGNNKGEGGSILNWIFICCPLALLLGNPSYLISCVVNLDCWLLQQALLLFGYKVEGNYMNHFSTRK